MWHSGWLINECEWHLGDCITTASERQIDDEDIVSYTFDGDSLLTHALAKMTKIAQVKRKLMLKKHLAAKVLKVNITHPIF